MNIKDFVDIHHSENSDGNMSSKYAGEEVAVKNRGSFFKKKNLDYNKLVYMSVDTDSNFRIIDHYIILDDEEKVNGLITQNKDLILGLVTADCAQIVLFDRDKKILALMHGGMLNIDGGILEKIISAMESSFDTKPKDILAYIGPSIRAESYKYDKNILFKLRRDSEVRKTLIKDSDNEYRIDIPQTIKNILIKEGVKKENILDSEIDTYTDKRYSSHVYTLEHNLPEFRFLTITKIRNL